MKRFLLSVVALLGLATFAFAQQMPSIPVDTALRMGVLPNGLTYYVRHNPKPENQAEFYILHNVGSIQEADDQQGLAHFLEHMAFNGTKNLPGKTIIEYLEKVGVKFGANLNAGTGMEQTIYNMSSVPLTRPGIVDTCLLILHDWSNFITLDPKEIDNERGVIIEELRTRNTADWRLREKSAPYWFGDTRYAHRNLIGHIDFLRSFQPEQLKRFYHDWYRTDQQAIIVVGDFDADEMVEKVKTVMADIPAVKNPLPKEKIAIPENKEPIVGILTDPEQTQTYVLYFIKQEPLPHEARSLIPVYGTELAMLMMFDMLDNRLEEIAQKPNAPFIGAGAGKTGLARTCDVALGQAFAREGEAETAFRALYEEFEKVRRFGFTSSELERVKADWLRQTEQTYDNRNDRRSSDLVIVYQNNYMEGTPLPSAETEYELDKMLLQKIDLNMINMLAQQYLAAENEVVTVISPEKEGITIPTAESIQKVMADVHAAELEAYEDTTVKVPLIPEGTELKGSPVVKSETDRFGATVWTLGNGIRIVVKPTDFKADEVRLSAVGTGGLSMLPDEDYYTANRIDMTVSQSGVGRFSSIELQKQLAGKSANVSTSTENYLTGIYGNGSPKDLETMLQLTYLYFTSPRWDESDFNVLMDNLGSQLKNIESNPRYIFQREVMKTCYADNMRCRPISTAMLEATDFSRMPELYQRIYGNAGNFDFILVGNVDPETIRPLVEKYIGSLPVTGEVNHWKDDGVRTVKGETQHVFEQKMEMPQTSIVVCYTGQLPYTIENKLLVSYLQQIMRTRYTEKIREEMGGTYSPQVAGTTMLRPETGYLIQIVLDTNREMADDVLAAIQSEMERMAAEGPSAEEMGKIKEFMVKQRRDQLKQNGSWQSYLNNYYANDFDGTTDYDAALEGITAEKVQGMAKKILSDDNRATVVMHPAQ